MWEGSVDPTGWLMSEKLDGVRAYWDGTQFWSRQSNKFYAPEWFLERLPPFPLDGELFGGRKKFQTTVSIVRRQDASDQWKDIRYRVFDVLEDGTAFELRMQKAQVWFGEHHPPFAEIHEQVPCTGLHHLQAELARILQLGGEGVMIRKPGSAYEHARTSSLLKVKRMQDAEAKVTGYTQGTGKYADGMAGALEVEMPNGKKFKIGTGLSDQDRLNPPPIGSVVTYQYQELSNDGIPRFPAFLRVRGDITWDDIKDNHIPTAPEKMGTRISMKRKELPERSTQGTSSVTSTAKKEYYEYIDATKHSAKFWELNLDGTVVAVRYGRIGTAGHVGNPKKFTTEQEAAKFAEKMRNAKLKEGYILNQHE